MDAANNSKPPIGIDESKTKHHEWKKTIKWLIKHLYKQEKKNATFGSVSNVSVWTIHNINTKVYDAKKLPLLCITNLENVYVHVVSDLYLSCR